VTTIEPPEEHRLPEGAHAARSIVLVSGSTQSAPHRSGAAGVQPFEHAYVAPCGTQNAIAGGHTELQPPQLVGFERSVSHPSAAIALQSAWPGSHDETLHALPMHPGVA